MIHQGYIPGYDTSAYQNILVASTGYSYGVNAFARSRTFISPNIIQSNTG